MATELHGFKQSQIAAVDLSASQYCGVKQHTVDGQVTLPSLGNHIVGVLQNAPTLGNVAEIVSGGVTKMRASAAITAGAEVSATAAGKAKIAITGEAIIGVAQSGAGADNEIISVFLQDRGLKPA
jgi:hypothetical protein